MKMKDKHSSPWSGAHLLSKAKKGLSVYFTLGIKLGFKWLPLTRSHICSVTNFSPPPLSPGGPPQLDHTRGIHRHYLHGHREQRGSAFRRTERTCLHKRAEESIFPHVTWGVDKILSVLVQVDNKYFDNRLWFTAVFFFLGGGVSASLGSVPLWGLVLLRLNWATEIFTLGLNHPRSSVLTCGRCCHNRAGAAVHRIQSVTPHSTFV